MVAMQAPGPMLAGASRMSQKVPQMQRTGRFNARSNFESACPDFKFCQTCNVCLQQCSTKTCIHSSPEKNRNQSRVRRQEPAKAEQTKFM